MTSTQPSVPTPAATAQPVCGAREDTAWLDLARIGAIAAVVLVHVVAPIVTGRWATEGTPGWWTGNLIDSAVRWCVPVFVMISGALLLDPRRVERPRRFYARRLARIGVPLIVWTLVYLGFRRWWLGQDLSVGDATRNVLAGTPFLQLYFLYVLVGLYAIAPFLKVVIRHTTRRMQAGLAGVLIGFGVVDQIAETLAGAGSATVATRFLPFAGYFVAGWVLRDIALTPRRVRAAAAWFAVSVAATAVLVGVVTAPAGWGAPGRYLYGYLSPTVVAMSLAAFLLFRTSATVASRYRGRLGTVAGVTFGIFLVHPLVLYPVQARWRLPDAPVAMVATLAVHLAITIAISVAITWLLRRVPYVRATVG